LTSLYIVLLKQTVETISPEAKVAFNLGTKVCGHRGIVHGGLTATLIDEVSGASAFSSIGPCFTANLNVDYKKPLKAECWILLRSYVTRIEGRKAWIETIVEDGDGIIYAKGTALFVRPRNSIDDHMKKQSTES
jgi:acyl-coenzyme A thioesterase PaaI-like protein